MQRARQFVYFVGLVALFLAAALPGAAQQAMPDQRFVFNRNVDFYGADLANLFDTTQSACERACAAQDNCVAFTFNTKSNACFPKSAITDRQFYDGAISAQLVSVDPVTLAVAQQRQSDLSFLTTQDLTAARDLVGQTARRFPLDGPDLPATSDSLRATGQMIAATDGAAYWMQLARIGLRENDQLDYQTRTSLRSDAVPAAINAYLRASDTALQSDALAVLAQALEGNSRGRDMIPTLRLANQLTPRPDLDAALDDAIGKYGFRITEHRVDSDAAAPRICAEFSEPLAQAGVDYAMFVRTDDPTLAVEADGQQICIDGVDHGARYGVTFRAGLPSASGETLARDVPLTLYVRDRTPLVRFPGRAYVLPRSADAALPIESVNVDQVDLVLRRVSDRNLVAAIRENYFGRPLNQYEGEQFSDTLAQEIWRGQGTVQNTLNADMTTRLPLGDPLAGQPAGIYTLSVSVPGQDPYDHPAATQWFILSDLGLTTWSGTDGLLVAVRKLSDTSAAEAVKLSLISSANAVLGTATVDEDGFAQFPAGLTRGGGASAPALLMAEDGTKDVAFLNLTDPAFDLSDRGVEGRPPSPPIDTFLTTDRGAYRAGETIYATALTRDAKAAALTDLPITAILKRPDGVEYSRTLSQDVVAGGHVFALQLGGNVPRGAWRLDILSDLDAPALASQTVLVEDFLPERIDFELTLPDAPLRVGDSPPLNVDVRYLFGAPGAGLDVSGQVRLRATRSLEGWEGYLFGRYDARFDTLTAYLDDATTDDNGRAMAALKVPAIDEMPSQPLLAEAIVLVSEGSGRPVERRLTKPLAPDQPLIGIKPRFEGVLSEGSEAGFDIAAVGTDGAPATLPVRWTLNKVETQYQWYQLYGNWEWEPVTRRIRVDTGSLDLGNGPSALTVPTEWGQYELLVEATDGTPAVSSVEFSSGWYGGDGSLDTPDRLAVSLDATEYDVGDTATLRLLSDTDGTALISVLSNEVVARQVVRVTAGENKIPLEVTEGWGAGAYVSASVIAPMSVSRGQNPSRSLGLAHAVVRPGNKALSVSIDAPGAVDGQPGILRAAVRVEGIAAGDTAYVTLAAVDKGILNLTAFKAPDVTGHYFGQRRLGVDIRDIYGRLIDGMNGAMGAVRSGGDAAANARLQSPPPTEKLMAFFSGPVTVGPDGRAEIDIIRPAFNGSIKLMAVAWSGTAVGDASTEVVARDPVVVTASLPRFLAPGDESRLLLELVNADASDGAAKLAIVADAEIGLGDFPSTVALSKGGSERISIPVTARDPGDPLITVSLTTSDGTVLRKVLSMPVRVNDPETAVTRQFSLGAGESFTFDENVFADMRLGTASATLTAGPLARFDVPGLLRQLDRYPYGCTEQVTSGALPLLYLSKMAEDAGLGAPQELAKKVNGAITQILTRQTRNGGFGMWSPQDSNFWLDAYVTDFLSRARTAGYDVPDVAFTVAMDNLRNRISYAPDFDRGGEDIAYALLVLAREGAANMGDLRYYADTKADNFATPLSLAQLAAALAAYGDSTRADALFAKAAARLGSAPDPLGWRDDYGSALRDAAGVLTLATEAGSTAANLPALVTQIGSNTGALSTQEAAQVVLAAHALADPAAQSNILVDGVQASGPVVQRLVDTDAASSVIQNTGTAPIDVKMTTFGVPVVPARADGYGYALTRSYFTMQGDPVSGPVTSGDRMVVVLKVTPFEEVGARLMVDDPLPAGFEIDNPNLIRSGDLAALDWLQTTETETAEFRSDRFLAAVNQRGSDPFQLAYVVRAVSPGVFHHPAALVTDMYRPEYRANTDAGEVTILP
jgi:alpha-2-macroglobulin